MIWYGMVWYAMLCYGVMWYSMVYGMVWYGMLWCGMVWCGMAWYGMIYWCAMDYGIVWYGVVLYGIIWYGILYSMVYGQSLTSLLANTPALIENTINYTNTCSSTLVIQVVQLSNAALQYHVYQLHDGGPSSEELEDDISAANHWLMPAGITFDCKLSLRMHGIQDYCMSITY